MNHTISEKVVATTIRPHTWTDGGDKVLILKAINADGTSKNGFTWPQSGEVVCPDWKDTDACGHGLHGWPWGIGIGDGREHNVVTDIWLVVACKPEDIRGEIEGGLKCKFSRGDVVFRGAFSAAWAMVNSGRHRCIEAMASKKQTGDLSSASQTGDLSSASQTGDLSSASQTGDRSSASQTGYRSSASQTGDLSSASQTGDLCSCAITGIDCTIDISASSVAAICAERFVWKVRRGAVVIQRWKDNESFPFAVLDSALFGVGVSDGDVLTFVKGVRE